MSSHKVLPRPELFARNASEVNIPDLLKESFYPESSFGGFTDVDGTVAFYTRVNALLRPASVVVDFGCGRGVHQEDPVIFRRNLCSLKGKVTKVIGLDVDAAGETNPSLDEFRSIGRGTESWPLEDHSVDLVLGDCVMEHLPNPVSFIQEARRVLVSGGHICLRTANRHSYVGFVSMLVPNRYHRAVLSKTKIGRRDEDIFPTLYRCNTIAALHRLLRSNNFRAVVYGHASEPNYLRFSKVAYGLGVLHQRLAPNYMRPSIFVFGQSR